MKLQQLKKKKLKRKEKKVKKIRRRRIQRKELGKLTRNPKMEMKKKVMGLTMKPMRVEKKKRKK